MKVKEIKRTAMLSWSPAQHHPIYLATGTSAQQLDASFSTRASLELFEFNLADPSLDMKSCGTLSSSHRYHKLVWSPFGIDGQGLASGVLIAGEENGNVILYDPVKILSRDPNVIIAESDIHTGPVRALDVNPFQTNLVASGGNESEIYIWDINNFGSPMTPGPKTQPLEDISCVAWNRQVQHILASTSPSGRTSVWDLRKNDLIIKVSDHSNRMHCSGMAWNPEVATQLVMASEDDRMPVIQMWDLRFASSPLKILENHTRGVLAIAWSYADPELLLSCGKDGRILCWNPNTAEILYELPTGNQWCFDIQWCPRNPAVLSAAGFNSCINIYSIMGGTSQAQSHVDQISNSFGNMDPFGTGQTLPPLELPQGGTLSTTVNPIKKPPKWIQRPVGASFAFGGKLVSLENGKPNSQQPNRHVVHVSQVVTETDLLKRSNQLQDTISSGQFVEFCQEKINMAENEFEKTVWSFLKANFDSDTRSRFLELLGYNKEELALKISAALTKKPTEMDFPPLCDAQPVADLNIVTAADNPVEAFDLIAAANLQPSVTQEMDSAPPTESEETLEVNAEEKSADHNYEIVDHNQVANGIPEQQWDDEEIILDEEVNDILDASEDVLQASMEDTTQEPVSAVQAPSEEPSQDFFSIIQAPSEEPSQDPFSIIQAPSEEPSQDPFSIIQAPSEEPSQDPCSIIQAPSEEPSQDPCSIIQAPSEEPSQDFFSIIQAPSEEPSQDPFSIIQATSEELSQDLFSDIQACSDQPQDPFSNIQAPNEEPSQDPFSNIQAPNEEPSQDPFSNIQAPNEEPSQDMFSNIQAPNEEPSQDPFSNIQAPNEEPLQDMFSNIQAPNEEPSQDPFSNIQAPNEEPSQDMFSNIQAPNEESSQDPFSNIQALNEEPLQDMFSNIQAPNEEPSQDMFSNIQAPNEEPSQDMFSNIQAPNEEPSQDMFSNIQAPNEEPSQDPFSNIQALNEEPLQDMFSNIQAPSEEPSQDPFSDIQAQSEQPQDPFSDIQAQSEQPQDPFSDIQAQSEEPSQDPFSIIQAPSEEPSQDPIEKVFQASNEQCLIGEVLKAPEDGASQVIAPVVNPNLGISRDVDRLITQALLTGDFEGAVELCLLDNRMADSIILAIAGGAELLEKTQKKYFIKSQSKLTKLISAVVMKDLHDILSTCDLQNWKEAMAAVMTYAQTQEFSSLCDLLGGRLEGQNDPNLQAQACLCYICAGNLEKLVSCWIKAQEGNNPLSLQDLVEKVVVMRHAVEQTQNVRPLAVGVLLAKKMSEYANLLASQGCLTTAITYLPNETNHVCIQLLRERLSHALGQQDPACFKTQSAPSQVPPLQTPTAGQSNNPYSVVQPTTTAPAHLQYYQPVITPSLCAQVRAASTVTSWSNQTPTAFPHVPPSLPVGTASDPSKVKPSSPMCAMPTTGTTAALSASSASFIHSHQYQTYAQVNQYPQGAGGLTEFRTHQDCPPGVPLLTEASVAPHPPGFLSHYSQPVPFQDAYAPSPHSSQCPSFSSSSNPPLFPKTSTSTPCAVSPSSMASFQPGGPGSPGSYMLPPPQSGVSGTQHDSGLELIPASQRTGPQNGWNDPPTLSRGPKKKLVPENYTPPAPITAPIMAPLGVNLQPQQMPSGSPQIMGHIPHAVQTPYSGMQQHVPSALNSMNTTMPKTSSEGAPGAPIGAVIQPPRSMPAEKITKKPIPDEHFVLKTTFEGLIQKCLTVATDPQTKRKLDDANKRLETLYDKLREHTLSPAIIGGLHNIARTIESRSYVESLNIHTHIVSSSNFSEISGFMPVLKVVLTQANKLGV